MASSLSASQISFISKGPKYIPPCQNRFSSRQTLKEIILKEYQSIIQCFKMGFNDYCISSSDQQARDFFSAIETFLRRLYTTPLPSKLQMRAQCESRLVKTIQKKLKNSNIILRQTDKSKVFHLGSAEDHHRKALEYMSKTNAYQELSSGINPYMDHLQAVLALIDPLLKKKQINLDQWKQTMRPDPKTIELAHLYFIPKPHKVCFDFITRVIYDVFFVFFFF